MRSSDAWRWVCVGVAVATGAASLSSCATGPAGTTAALCPGAPQSVRTLQSTLERSRLFHDVVGAAPAACRVEREGTATRLRYDAANGNSIVVDRDTNIEYTRAVIRYATPLDAGARLADLERIMFGRTGCGIDYAQGEAFTPRPDRAGVRYRGSTCNCSIASTADRAGHVVELDFRSTC